MILFCAYYDVNRLSILAVALRRRECVGNDFTVSFSFVSKQNIFENCLKYFLLFSWRMWS